MQRIPNKSTEHEMDQCRISRKKEAPIGCVGSVCVCVLAVISCSAGLPPADQPPWRASTHQQHESGVQFHPRAHAEHPLALPSPASKKTGMRSKSKMPALRSSDLTQCKDFTLQQVKAFDRQVQALLVLDKLQTEAGVLRCVAHGNWGQRAASAQ